MSIKNNDFMCRSKSQDMDGIVCNVCFISRPVHMFAKRDDMKNGRLKQCAQCMRSMRTRRIANKEADQSAVDIRRAIEDHQATTEEYDLEAI